MYYAFFTANTATSYVFFIAVALLSLCSQVYAVDWGVVATRDNRGTVLLHVNWADEKGPQGGTGTGFVVNRYGDILTVAHQFPRGEVETLAEAQTEELPNVYGPQTFTVEIVHMDRDLDVAVLRPVERVTLVPLPTIWDWVPNEQARVTVRGFPLGRLLEGRPGYIRRSGLSREVPTDIILQAGHSGSPVYDDTGHVIGMARGGTPFANLKEDPTVMGLGFFTPLSLFKELHQQILARHEPSWFDDPKIVGMDKPNMPVSPSHERQKRANEIRMAFSVSAMKETPYSGLHDLTRPAERQTYSKIFKAEPGYRIVGYEVDDHSTNQVTDRSIQISEDGSAITFSFSLTSGPGYDRKRGWLDASLITTQQTQ